MKRRSFTRGFKVEVVKPDRLGCMLRAGLAGSKIKSCNRIRYALLDLPKDRFHICGASDSARSERQPASSFLRLSCQSRTSLALGIITILNHAHAS